MKVKGVPCELLLVWGRCGPSTGNQWENENALETFEAQSRRESCFPLIVFE